MKVTIHQNEKGLLFRNGRFVKVLEAGVHHALFRETIQVCRVCESLAARGCTLDILLQEEGLFDQVTEVQVADQHLLLHFVDGRFDGCLTPGRHAFWNAAGMHTFLEADTSVSEVAQDIPTYLFRDLPEVFYIKAEVAEFQRACLYLDNRFVRLLDPGTYYFWRTEVKVEVLPIDTRLLQMGLSGQEMLTQDKVTLRINFALTYRVTDCAQAQTRIGDYEEQLRLASQLSLRDCVGQYCLDDLLRSKDEVSREVLRLLQDKARALYLEVADAGIKDLILPGEIRDIMNGVLAAEKRAQANVITRREEVASTRSLLNTARLMEENPTLYRLKELEALERICQQVGSISVTGSGDLLTQLTQALRGG